MITHLDESLRAIVEVFKRKDMWKNTLVIAFADNGGDVITGASNWPYRGTKGTPWEGGTRAAAFVSSPNSALIPSARRGTESHTLIHVSDWYPTLLGLAGVEGDLSSKPLDGHDVWSALVANTYPGPRKEMLYMCDTVVPEGGEGAFFDRVERGPFMWHDVVALRVGDWKLIEGYPGRGDWYGEDPSLAWPADYIMGPDVTDFEAIPKSKGGKVGDGGQRELKMGTIGVRDLKKRWLFNLASDPYEHRDLQFEEPNKVKELLARVEELRNEQVPPLQDGVVDYFNGRRQIPPGLYVGIASSGKTQPIVDMHEFDTFPDEGKVTIDGEEISTISLQDARKMMEARREAASAKL